mgnify:FL=1
MGGKRNPAHRAGLQKAPTAISGFDEISGGGIPASRTTLLLGGPGSGKTIFALQTLVNAARTYNEPSIFVAFEEKSAHLIANAASFDWELDSLIAPDEGGTPLLTIVDTRLSPDIVVSGDFDLSGILALLDTYVRQTGARRIVFDGIDVLLTLLDNPNTERREIYRLRDWLLEKGLTAILTAKTDDSGRQFPSQYSFMQFMVDCMVVLTHTFSDRVSLRRMTIVKYRGSDVGSSEVPFAICSSGIEVSSPGKVEMNYQVSQVRISTGIDRLNAMLGGGFYRGSATLFSGAPGTGKTTLATSFCHAACQRQERTLYISFDESWAEIIRNLNTIHVHLQPFVASGLLRMYSARTEARSSDEHQIRIEELIAEHNPACLVIDPLSAIIKVGGVGAALSVARYLLRLAKTKGITLIFTSLLESTETMIEATPLEISTLADTWIHLTYLVRAGERNWGLTIVKSRGTAHSRQVRELLISDQGVTLADVYTAGGEVLMGTARWERERADSLEKEKIRHETERKRRELEAFEAEIKEKIDTLAREVETRRSELNTLLEESELREKQWRQTTEDITSLRGGGAEYAGGGKPKRTLKRKKGQKGGVR